MSTPLVKIVVAGDPNVGKTSLIRRYTKGKFEDSRVATIGVDFHTHTVDLAGERKVRLSIWDMAGQEQFKVVRPGIYRGSLAAALVYDVTVTESLKNLHKWREEILDTVRNQKFIVVGNKIDLDKRIISEEARQFAGDIKAAYLETSALTGEGVAEMFMLMAQLALSESAT